MTIQILTKGGRITAQDSAQAADVILNTVPDIDKAREIINSLTNLLIDRPADYPFPLVVNLQAY